jgi:hypothetical protein
MTKEGVIVHQIKFEDLNSKEQQQFFLFKKQAIIYFENGRFGSAQEDFYAIKLEGQKVKKYSAYKTCQPVEMYLNNRSWIIAENTKFGAPVHLSKKVR